MSGTSSSEISSVIGVDISSGFVDGGSDGGSFERVDRRLLILFERSALRWEPIYRNENKRWKIPYRSIMKDLLDESDHDDDVIGNVGSISELDADIGSISIKGKSSKMGVGEDSRLIIVGVLNIFNGESNVIVGMSASSASDRCPFVLVE